MPKLLVLFSSFTVDYLDGLAGRVQGHQKEKKRTISSAFVRDIKAARAIKKNRRARRMIQQQVHISVLHVIDNNKSKNCVSEREKQVER